MHSAQTHRRWRDLWRPLALVPLLVAAGVSRAEAQSIEETLYLRGEMNGWGTGSPMTYLGNDTWQANIDLVAGYYRFKIANDGWDINYAVYQDQPYEFAVDDAVAVKNWGSSGGNENILPVDTLSGFTFTFQVRDGNPDNATLLIEQTDLSGPEPTPLPENPDDTLSWRGETAAITVDDANAAYRSYRHFTTVPLRDNAPPTRMVEYSELPGDMTLRSGSLLFDALFARALDEARLNSVDAITDGSFNNGQPTDCDCFQTGDKWHYVWTRDTAYSMALGLSLFDPTRAKNSLLYKLSERRQHAAPHLEDGPEIVQDTGSGGSWPISTDRVSWALGAWETLKYLQGDEREAFRDQAYEAIVTTVENDRRAIFDPEDGLYRGEQSFLDWREQTYPSWTATDVVHIGMSKSLSTNVAHHTILEVAAALADEKGNEDARDRYTEWADALKTAINQELWLDGAGLYSTLKTTTLDPEPVKAFDLLGESLAVTEGIASPDQAASIVENYPVTAAGPPVIWPQYPDVAIYHNRGIWPFVTAFALRAARDAQNDAAVNHNVMSLVRLAALNLSNMENYEFLTGRHTLLDGDLTGPVINSQRQLWSVAGYLSMVLDGVFGLQSTQEGIRFKPFLTRELRNTLFADTDTLTLTDFPYKGRHLSVKVELPAVDDSSEGYYAVDEVVLNGHKISADDVISVNDLADGGNELVIRLADNDLAQPGTINLVEVEDPLNLTDSEYDRIFAPREPALLSIDETRSGRLQLTLDDNGEENARFNIIRNGELYAEGISGTTWTDPDDGIWQATERLRRFTPQAGTLTSNGADPVFERGRWHFADWGAPDELLEIPELEARETGKHYLQVTYGNALNSINTGITATTKWLEVRDLASGDLVAEGVVTMPHRSSLDDWGDSSLFAVSLEAGHRYSVTIRDHYNMSYFEHFAIYNGAGGRDGPVNRANIAEVKLMPESTLYCYAVELASMGSGNRSHHSEPQCYLPDFESRIVDLSHDVEALSAVGTLNKGQASSLLSELERAEVQLSHANDGSAVNMLHAFSNDVSDLEAEGVLATEDADAFRSAADALVQSLQ
ncbi:MGH1-like glycoside hydrolase domain-containing protein [Halomonas stenophila]|uniref:Glycogen debranching enzyme n=1 Tax=Halomonas stenophila TaxID=795312 RepID=A0A7W5HJA0_9GAMM|nr:hypothetical protein [Halomonas stenophila]MBB3229196.1 glycogen debranching enzyme [Halomonas stenophila]